MMKERSLLRQERRNNICKSHRAEKRIQGTNRFISIFIETLRTAFTSVLNSLATEVYVESATSLRAASSIKHVPGTFTDT